MKLHEVVYSVQIFKNEDLSLIVNNRYLDSDKDVTGDKSGLLAKITSTLGHLDKSNSSSSFVFCKLGKFINAVRAVSEDYQCIIDYNSSLSKENKLKKNIGNIAKKIVEKVQEYLPVNEAYNDKIPKFKEHVDYLLGVEGANPTLKNFWGEF